MTDHDEMLILSSPLYHLEPPKVRNQECTMSTLNPINYNPTRTVELHSNLYHHGFESNSPYNSHGVTADNKNVQKRQRKLPQAVENCSISFTPPREHKGDGNISAIHRLGSGPSRRERTDSNKRKPSSKSQIITPKPWVQEKYTYSSIATTSSTNSLKGSSTAKYKTNTNPNPLFKESIITKLSSCGNIRHAVKENSHKVEDSSIKHQGFVTSRESVQTSSSLLTKTTMDKLAAFGCQPSSVESREAARAWWSSSGRPINEAPSKEYRPSLEIPREHPAIAVDIETPETSKALPLLVHRPPASPISDEFDEGILDCDLLAIQVESDDDYPMDESDEQELLKLVALGNVAHDIQVQEPPPSNALDAFDHEHAVYDSSLQFSPPKQQESICGSTNENSLNQSPEESIEIGTAREGEGDWGFISAHFYAKNDNLINSNDDSAPQNQLAASRTSKCTASVRREEVACLPISAISRGISVNRRVHACTSQVGYPRSVVDNNYEYQPLKPFIRPPFPILIMDRCPINGLSMQSFLRTCFRIGEMYQIGSKYDAMKLDAVIELFARVNFSSREPGTTKQHFQFMDLWHERAPFPNGVLESYRTTGLVESESKVFLSGDDKKMARILGRLKRDVKNTFWFIQIINIRTTDWEEIRWTKRIVSGDDIAKKIELGAAF